MFGGLTQKWGLNRCKSIRYVWLRGSDLNEAAASKRPQCHAFSANMAHFVNNLNTTSSYDKS